MPAIKQQIAMYEKFGLDGIGAYIKTIEYAKKKELVVIGDIKRGDISSTAEAYASHIGGTDVINEHFDLWKEDFATVNPYLGYDGIKPFIEACNNKNKGIFVLVKTSNNSSKELQDLKVGNKKVYEIVAEYVSDWGSSNICEEGFSRVGAVVGATHKSEGEALRKVMQKTFFLVPGYGAQGARAIDLKGFFNKDKRGCIINSSRGITAAYFNDERYDEKDFAEAAREAAILMKREISYV